MDAGMNERPPGLDKLLDYVTARLEEPTECGRCEHQFQHPPGHGYGVTRYRNTQWCTDCVDRCHDSELADHRCAVCQ